MALSTDLPRCSYLKDVLSRGCQKQRTNGSPTECFGPQERGERGGTTTLRCSYHGEAFCLHTGIRRLPQFVRQARKTTTDISFIMRSRFGEVCSCCSYNVLPGPAWVVLKCAVCRIKETSVYDVGSVDITKDLCHAKLERCNIVKKARCSAHTTLTRNS